MYSKHNTNIVFQFYFMYQKNQFAKNEFMRKNFILIKRVPNQALRVETAIPLYFSAHIIRLLC